METIDEILEWAETVEDAAIKWHLQRGGAYSDAKSEVFFCNTQRKDGDNPCESPAEWGFYD